ncbi:TPA: hypothetical protein ACGSW7_004763 [Yersinia enterocolitica]|jgi:hypothetical protein|nr:hypothetical protein [Yersinia enterocolitica]
MAGSSISANQLKTRREFYTYLDGKMKDGNSRFSLFLEKDNFCFSLYLLFTSNEGERNSELIRRFRSRSRSTVFIVSNLKFWLKEYNRSTFK